MEVFCHPYYFAISMDDRSILLSDSGIGCHFDDLLVLHYYSFVPACILHFGSNVVY